MKTKEIIVYFDRDTDFENTRPQDLCGNIHGGTHGIRAKIIIEIPEKTIAITESELDAAIERTYSLDTHLSFISLKQELGF